MLIFFDETFRKHRSGTEFGALCGIAIPEDMLGKVIVDVYHMKHGSMGEKFAREREIKGVKLLKNKNLARFQANTGSPEVNLVIDLLRYIARQRFVTFGVVCFRAEFRTFRCADPLILDLPYRALFERIDGYMKNEYPDRRAKIVFDDVDYASNAARATSITNFFNRTAIGRGYDQIIRTPFFSVSQAQNVGLELADLVTTVYGMRFQGERRIKPMFRELKRTIYRYRLGKRMVSSLRRIK